ncbi:MAG: hypothetical protein HXY35_01560 [Chloroflexi bacterium]|nr:hypothetical protein [Chloroflexota bacterium]
MTRQQLIHWAMSTLRESAWAPLSVVAFYLIGLLFHFYDLFPPLDIPTHFMGGVTITYFYRSAIKNSQSFAGNTPLPMQVLLAFTCTGTTTILWEFYEYLFDHFFGTHMVRGLEDTLLDMFLGLFGALTLSILHRRR